MKRIIEILRTPEGQAKLEERSRPTAIKFRDKLADIAMHVQAAGMAAVAVEILKGGPK